MSVRQKDKVTSSDEFNGRLLSFYYHNIKKNKNPFLALNSDSAGVFVHCNIVGKMIGEREREMLPIVMESLLFHSALI